MTQTDLKNLIEELRGMIGTTLVAFVADTQTRAQVETWGQNDSWPDDDQIERLELAHELFNEVSNTEGADLARTWIIGSSCGVDGEMSPAEAIRYNNFEDARTSAKRLIEGS